MGDGGMFMSAGGTSKEMKHFWFELFDQRLKMIRETEMSKKNPTMAAGELEALKKNIDGFIGSIKREQPKAFNRN